MNTLRIVVAAAAVIVVAIAGINLLPAQGVGTGPTAPPSPTPGPTSTPTRTSTPSPTVSLPPGVSLAPSGGLAMAPGTYLIEDPFPLRVTVTVGEGWTSWSGTRSDTAAFYKGSADPPNGVGFGVLIVDNLNADACDLAAGRLDPPLGSTPDDLANALADQPMTEASTVTDVAMAGYNGRYLEYTMTGVAERGCTDGQVLERWPCRQALVGEHDKLWILDVDGVRLVIDAFSFPGTSDADHAEIQAIVDSIRIE